MKAAVYKKYGLPEVVLITDVLKPIPKDNEVLVKIHATTVNRTDCGFRSANYFIVRFFSGLFVPNNKILGNEFAGVIEAVGRRVTTFKINDKVFGYNDTTFGAHAEFMVIPEKAAITTMPENVSFATAAAISEGAHYALCNLRAAKVKSGQTILINGATGAIGSAAVQLSIYFGAQVTAICDTKNVALVKSLGAQEVIDYTLQDFTALTKLFDVVFDAVGKSSFKKCKPLLKNRGIYMSTELGKRFENPFLAIITSFSIRKRVLFPIPASSKKDIIFLKELVATGKYKPVIDRNYPLEQIVDAYKYVETGQKIGTVIITV